MKKFLPLLLISTLAAGEHDLKRLKYNNPGGSKLPVFKKAIRIGKGTSNVHASYPNGEPVVLLRGAHLKDFVGKGYGETEQLYKGQLTEGFGHVRAKQWKMASSTTKNKERSRGALAA
jgi:hypothetical protein